jgi:hypothetical protein
MCEQNDFARPFFRGNFGFFSLTLAVYIYALGEVHWQPVSASYREIKTSSDWASDLWPPVGR